jgi:hypothetical protein
MTRTGATWTSYYLSSNGWVVLATGTGPTTPINFSPSVFNLSNVLPFGGQATIIRFTEFDLHAEGITCP